MPTISKEALSHILATQDFNEFRILVHGVDELRELAEVFPDHAAQLFECFERAILVDKGGFYRLVDSVNVNTVFSLAEAFPDHTAQMWGWLERAIQDFNGFILLNDVSGLLLLAEAFPDHTAQLFECFERAILDRGKFRRLVDSVNIVFSLAEAFPDHKAQMWGWLERAIQDFNGFRILVHGVDELRLLTEIFPEHTEIFNKDTVEEAWEAIQYLKSKDEIESTASVLAEGLSSQEGFLPRLNQGILRRITLYAAGIPSAHNIPDAEEPEKIAAEALPYSGSPAAASNR